MSKKARLKSAAVVVSVPQNRQQVATLIAAIGTDSRELTRIETEMNDELATVKARYEEQADPIRQRVEAAQSGVQTWCEANRDELTQHNKVKTAAFPTGEIQWRMRPPSVRITGQEAVLDVLRRRALGRFIRTKEEVNKEAILNEPEAVAKVPGIAISQGEDFVVTPFEVELAEASS